MAQSLCEQLRESPMFQVGEGESGEKDNDNIAEEFSLGKSNLPRIYDDSTLATFIEKDSLLRFQVS